MRKLMGAIVLVAVGLWATAALASDSDYASLGNDASNVAIGAGGIFLSGDDALGAKQTEFLPTVNVSGLAKDWSWQVFYAFGDPQTVFGGSADYILASNFDDCATCGSSSGQWWFGIGPSLIRSENVFEDATGANGMSCTCYGGNVGFGWASDHWNFQLYGHYLANSGDLAAQASINYTFN